LFLMTLLMIPMLVLIPLIRVNLSVVWIRDEMRWRKWNRDQQTKMTGSEFIKLMMGYRSVNKRLRFTKFVRENGLVEATVESELSLVQLALDLELEVRRRDARVLA